MNESNEQHWSCGCVRIDGKLERECTQKQHVGEMKAHEAATAKPYSSVCFRQRQEQSHPPIESNPEIVEASNGVQE